MEQRDLPRSLKSRVEIQHRASLLLQPHILPLHKLVLRLRARGLGEIPEFDPLDGGINAQALFVYEKPGPKAFVSGFISRNNDDPTAEATFDFMQKAKIDRKKTCLWNVVPGWNGTVKTTPQELLVGTSCLLELIDLLPELRVIVAVGKRAERALRLAEVKQFDVLTSLHPSPKNRAIVPKKWIEIPTQWERVLSYFN